MCVPSPTRRAFLGGTSALAVTGTALGMGLTSARSQDGTYEPPPLPTVDGVAALTPDEALARLQEGNAAFVANRVANVDLSQARRSALEEGQTPFCAMIACSDSRVPPELLFGQGLGKMFVIRNAGNTVDTLAMGSLEFAVGVLKVPLVVVMGHEACGAVKAAMAVVDNNTLFPGALGRMVEPIIPAVLEARGAAGDATQNAIRQNVRRVARGLRDDSQPILRDPQLAGAVKVVGAYYDLDGPVTFFDGA